MSDRWPRVALQIYRWAGVAAYPVTGIYVGLRMARGKEMQGRLRERYGYASKPRPDGPLVWVHAVSVGETGAVFQLVTELAKAGLNIVLTTGTVTSARMAESRLPPGVIHQFVPLDFKPAVSRFLANWKPDLAIFAESEIWPMTTLELGARRIPQVLINGRMSDRSFQRWHKRLPLAESLFENFSHVAAQTKDDAERFRALGARPVSVTGNLKVDVPTLPVSDADLVDLTRAIGNRPVWAAISTHDGEELVAIRAHRALKKRWPDLLTVIVPRHPARAGDIRKLCTEAKLTVATRTRDSMPFPTSDIFLGDTIGEMGLYLRMAQVCLVGRSLRAEGGQNPLEPAMVGCAVLSGPNIANFQEVYDRLVRGNGARIVDDEVMLARAVHHLLGHPETRQRMTQCAQKVVTDMQGALTRTLRSLDPYIHPLIVEAGLYAHTAKPVQPPVEDDLPEPHAIAAAKASA